MQGPDHGERIPIRMQVSYIHRWYFRVIIKRALTRQQMAWWLEPWTCALAAFCTFFVLTDYPGWYVVRKLRKKLIWAKEQEDEQMY